MNSEVTILVHGHVQWRFQPHRSEADEIITMRMPQYPPVPIGATVQQGGETLGTVRCVQRRQFNRWALVIEPVDGGDISEEIVDPAAGIISQEILADGTVNITLDAEGLNLPPGAVVDLDVVDGAVEVTVGTPISALSDHLDARVLGTVEQLAHTVEELNTKTDSALKAIDGIGPKRLEEIRAACTAVLNG